jgi:hypothetical protein
MTAERTTACRSTAYILPIKLDDPEREAELGSYLDWLAQVSELIVVDGSAASAFARHESGWPSVRLVAPDPALRTTNGKVWGVLTGLALTACEKVIVADDDVRYEPATLERMAGLLDTADIVRPQNYFSPAPWHAQWDSARSLVNRVTGGDWPGTLGLRRSALPHGYDGNCLFENLEMVRTVVANGGRELIARDLFVRRLPPSTAHFLSQRVRQAYDEWARPVRFASQLALLPLLALAATRYRALLPVLAGASIALAEAGRRRWSASRYFSPMVSLMAPLWLCERAVCAWLAFGMRFVRGGAIYHGMVIARPATPLGELRTLVQPEPIPVAAKGGKL